MNSKRIETKMWPVRVIAAGNSAAVCESYNGGAGCGVSGAASIGCNDLLVVGGLN